MNELEKMNNTDIMSIFQKSDNILTDIQNIIETYVPAAGLPRGGYHFVSEELADWVSDC